MKKKDKLKRKTTNMTLLTMILAVVLILITPAATPAASSSEVQEEVTAAAEYLLSTVDTDSLTIEDYKIIIYLQRSGVECNELVTAYLELIKDMMNDNGAIIYNGSENPYIYAAVMIVTALADLDATEFNDSDIIKKFEASMNSFETPDDFKTYTIANNNLYYLQNIMAAAKAYSYELKDADRIFTLVKDVVLSYYIEDPIYGTGVDLWGVGEYDYGYGPFTQSISADDNGKVMPILAYDYNKADIKDKADKAINWTLSLLDQNGVISSWGMESASSTALALRHLAAFKNEKAELTYTGLLSFKNPVTGAYQYAGTDDPAFATPDALEGLLTYSRTLAGTTDFLDVSDTAVGLYPVIINKINAIPDVITLSEGSLLNEITALYAQLPDSFQDNVINYSVFVDAFAAYEALLEASDIPDSTEYETAASTTYETTDNDTTLDDTKQETTNAIASPPTGDHTVASLLILFAFISSAIIILSKKKIL